MKIKNLIIQLIKFSAVGIIATFVDMASLILLTEVLYAEVLVASAVSFCISVIINYILSMRFVFKGRDDSKIKEFCIFLMLSILGLIINQLIMWAGVRMLVVHYMWVKVFATCAVLIFNFISRKIFIEKH